MSAQVSSKPNVVLVIADSMRARNVSCYGYPQETTPNLDRMAERGIRFENAFTVAPFTVASTASILTGVYPSMHRLERYGQRLSDDLVTLPELLQSAGYYTAGFVANPHVNSDAGLTRGFSYFTEGRPWYKRLDTTGRVTAWAESGKALNRRVQAQLRRLEKRDQPYFFLIFYNDSHVPFSGLPRLLLPLVGQKYHTPDFETMFYTDSELEQVMKLYDESIRRADRRLGQLLSILQETHNADNTALIFTADHGEGLDRRFERAGHGRLYDNGIHIPLVIDSPTILTRGQVVNDMVSTLDIAPTVCDLVEIETPQQFQGRSLRDVLEGRPQRQPVSHVISEYHDSRAVRAKEWKLIQRGCGIGDPYSASPEAIELYDVSSDASEEVNLATERRDCADQLSSVLQQFAASAVSAGQMPASFTKDDLTLERLRGLGYVE